MEVKSIKLTTRRIRDVRILNLEYARRKVKRKDLAQI